MFFIGGLSRCQPLQSSAFVRRLDLDLKLEGLAFRGLFLERNLQRTSIWLEAWKQLPFGNKSIIVFDADIVDIQMTGVEQYVFGLRVRNGDEFQDDLSIQSSFLEINLEVSRRVLREEVIVI